MANKDFLDRNFRTIEKRSNAYRDVSVYCKNCGHTVVVISVDRVLCSHCGYWVYKDDKTEFRYKMMENIRKGK